MKNINFKHLMIIVTLLALCILVTGCDKAISDDTISDVIEQSSSSVSLNDESSILVPENSSSDITNEKESSSSLPETSSTEQNEQPSPTQLSGDWTNMDFMLDGKIYKLPFSYSELEASGWSFDLSDYGYDNGYSVNPNTKVHSTITLENPAFDKKLMVYAGFVNNSNEPIDIKKCDIWSFEINTVSGLNQVSSFPNMTVANGITFGTSKAEVESICGPCDDIYDGETYDVYTYSVDYHSYLKLNIYDNLGVTSINLKTFN